MFCKNCGNEIADNSTTCPNCGTSVAPVNNGPEKKSKLLAGLLGIFLGGLGIHNFYLGYTGKAVAQIILSFCCGIGAIWGFIEGILILTGTIKTDASGVELAD